MIDRELAKTIRERYEDFSVAMAKEFGLVLVRPASCRYGDSTLSLTKIEFEGRVDPDAERTKFLEHARMFGLQDQDYKRKFKSMGNEYVLVKLNPRANRYPVIGADIFTGKRYKFTATVLDGLYG